ncbi:MAG: M48 family metalloprotease [Candidatus Eisenbacteria bacterium]|uniref:M48 family metalloprotease n=1 Tax=Eiseniibacteriota bacterium TaxID=2212470 RepID=A0A849SCJ0_UNCEI|nr:M48 family metalloprotease [Candidatus Eisenbacteria bacterium]
MKSRLQIQSSGRRGAGRRLAASLGTLFALTLWLVWGCSVNPVTGKNELSLMSAAQEVEVGKEGHQAVVSEYGVYPDAALSRYVDSLGHALARVSHLPNLDWHFTVLDDPIVNAFALPGGYIYVTRGILAHLNSEAQLAGVVGHEIGHVTARHGAKRATQQQLTGLGLGVAGLLSSTVREYSQAAQTALGLLMLKYGRDDENQADELGVNYSTGAGWDSREMPGTYELLARIGARSGSTLPGFLSTHPDPGDRQVRTTNLSRAATAGKTGLIVRERDYVRRLNGMVYGSDPRNGYFEGAMFYHPEMDLQMSFPSGWQTQNSAQAVLAVKPDQKAGLQLTLANTNGLAPAEFVAELQRQGKLAATNGSGASIGGFPAWSGVATVPKADGSTARIVLAFVRRAEKTVLQLSGSSAVPGDADETALLQSIRSLRAISDASKRNPAIPRLSVIGAPRSGSFQEVLNAIPNQTLGADETAILNNRQLDQPVQSGESIKVVRSGAR